MSSSFLTSIMYTNWFIYLMILCLFFVEAFTYLCTISIVLWKNFGWFGFTWLLFTFYVYFVSILIYCDLVYNFILCFHILTYLNTKSCRDMFISGWQMFLTFFTISIITIFLGVSLFMEIFGLSDSFCAGSVNMNM